MTADEVQALFTRSDGQFLFARWARPIVPVVFGASPETLAVIKGAIEAVVTLAGHKMAEVDMELGANLMVFFVRDWAELLDVPNLERLIEGLAPLIDRLNKVEANQYRVFRFDPSGGIRAAFVFVKMDTHLESVPAEVLALGQAVQVVLLWSDTAFLGHSPLVDVGGRVILQPEIGALIRASYDPVLPASAHDGSHALRLAARIVTPQ